VKGFDCEVDVCFNNEIPFDKILEYDKVILSPGPGLPIEAGQLNDFINQFNSKIPMLGICLGFQALIEFYGGNLINQKEVKHGIKELCYFDNESDLFLNTPNEFNIGLYHSWAADKSSFPNVLKITATSENDVIMGFEHLQLPIYGVQFHPESIMTEHGLQIIQNFLLAGV
jgi:anthranilate synthase component 2